MGDSILNLAKERVFPNHAATNANLKEAKQIAYESLNGLFSLGSLHSGDYDISASISRHVLVDQGLSSSFPGVLKSAALIPSTALPVEMTYLKTNGEVWDLERVDSGRSGIILKLNATRVLKAPLIIHKKDASEEEKFAADCLKDDNISFLENEKATFQRLGHYEHIVEWHAVKQPRSQGVHWTGFG